MSGTVLAALVIVAALAAVGLPLMRASARPLGRGLEDDAPVQRWQAERARLVGQLQDNDLARAEGRLDAATHAATAIRLSQEAEAVMDRLRAARREFATLDDAPARPGRAGSALALLAVLGIGIGAAQLARWQNIDLTGSPHADGRVPLDLAGPMPDDTGTGAGPVTGADGVPDIGAPDIGAPDIGAMVARLEARVAGGDASAEEIKMLLRSYDTLGRMEEARAVLDGALARFPDDPDFRRAGKGPVTGELTGEPAGADGAPDIGAPDIGAMVARLEGRVAAGDASADEIKMLLRSYDTLGRMEEARTVLDGALARFPDDPDFRIGWLRAALTSPRDGDSARGLPVAEALIAEMPDLLEARWYRSLFLVAEGRRDEARTELMWMAPRLPADSPAERAVAGLLSDLAGAPTPAPATGN